jgi:hypothetical protein
MKQTLYIDPRIRDYVFIPLVILMFIVGLLRFYVTKLMNAPDNPLLNKASVSHKALKKTLFERDADLTKEAIEEEFDINKALDGIKDDIKDK